MGFLFIGCFLIEVLVVVERMQDLCSLLKFGLGISDMGILWILYFNSRLCFIKNVDLGVDGFIVKFRF